MQPKSSKKTLLSSSAPVTGLDAPSAPAWVDPDDDSLKVDLSGVARLRKLRKDSNDNIITGSDYQSRLKEYYQKTLANPEFTKWADKASSITKTKKEKKTRFEYRSIFEDADLSSISKSHLDSGILDISHQGNLPFKNRLACVVQSVDFHPRMDLFLAAGFDKNLKIFEFEALEFKNKSEISLKTNVFFENFPINKAQFSTRNPNEVLLCGRKKHLYCYDMETEKTQKISSYFFTKNISKQNVPTFCMDYTGDLAVFPVDSGSLEFMALRNKQVSFDLQMDERCTGVAFGSVDSNTLYSCSELGNIYIWDLRQRKIREKFKDEGSIKTTTIASTSSGLLATGSDSGFVNFYGSLESNEKRKPEKRFDNVTTAISSLAFSPNGYGLLFASKWKSSSCKIASTDTLRVYSNWPNFQTRLGSISCTGFSRDSSLLLIGNDGGNVEMYKVGLES